MKIFVKNYAFIDSQNLNLGIQELGWKLSYRKFRVYLKEKYNVDKAFMFIGFVPANQKLYDTLENAGFILKFKPIVLDDGGKIIGNVDADIVLHTMIDVHNFDKAVIVSGDGDFYSLVRYLYKNNKLETVLSPHINNCSSLLKIEAKERISFMDTLKQRLEYINEKAPLEDETSRSAFP